MLNIKLKNKIPINQKGLASIFISMIMMIVITLIVIGFITIADRERTESLDKQLSTAALYSAESGINEAKSLFSSDGYDLPAKYGCGSDSNYVQTLDQATNINISCLTVNPTPNFLNYNNISIGQNKVAYIDSSNGDDISSINVAWQDANLPASPTFNCITSGEFPPSIGASCGAGVLRLDIVPALNLASDTTLFLYPSDITTNTNITVSSANGQAFPANCQQGQSQGDCSIDLTFSPATETAYYIRIIPIYEGANVNLGAYYNSMLLSLKDGEVEVDSTGKAGNVLQRVQTMLSVVNNIQSQSLTTPVMPLPNNALESTSSICKQIYDDGSTTTDGSGGSCPPF